eukprot:3714428-Amphidinium_carterae.1
MSLILENNCLDVLYPWSSAQPCKLLQPDAVSLRQSVLGTARQSESTFVTQCHTVSKIRQLV